MKSEEEVDALGLYLFADSPEGREHARGIDETISAVPGLKGLTLLEDYIDARRAAERPGWAGVTPVPGPPRDNGRPPAPTHWVESEEGRPDVMPATSEVERREQARAAQVMRAG